MPTRALRRFRRLLRMYPRTYRERYGTEMESFFRQEWDETRGGVAFWLRQILDHGAAAWSVRRRERGRQGGGGMMKGWGDDLRISLRRLARAPVFTGFAIGTLALGIGAATSVFTVLDRVVLRPLPYPAGDRLAIVGSEFGHDPGGLGPLSGPQIQELIESPGPAEVIVASRRSPVTLTGLGDPERIAINSVSEGFFELLGATPSVGRLLDDRDQQAEAELTAVVDHGFWMDRFGGDPEALGREITLNDQPYRLVGVLSEDFVRPESVTGEAAIWVPAQLREEGAESGNFGMWGLARLSGIEQLDAFTAYATDRFTVRYPFLTGATVRDYRRHVVGNIGGRIGSAMAGVLLLLLIACANVASLTLTRVEMQRREMSVRSALGAGRGHLLRLSLTESGLLATAGGLLGGGIAVWAVTLFRTYAPSGIPRIAEVGFDPVGFAFALGLSVTTLVLFGAVPAVSGVARARSGLAGMAGRATPGRQRLRARAGLVTAETALAAILVVGSGLLASDLIRLASEDSGYRADGLTSVGLQLRGRVDDADGWTTFWEEALAAAERIPGVTSAALTTQLPYDGVSVMQSMTPEGAADETFVASASYGGDFFESLGIRTVEGRLPSEDEIDARVPVALVSEAFLQEYWPDDDPLGREIRTGDEMDEDAVVFSVIGVIADVRTDPGVSAPPQVYVPFRVEPRPTMEVVVRSDPDAPSPAPALRDMVRQLDPGLPVTRLRTLEAVAASALDRPRFYTGLFGGFASVALLLALVGIYGTTAYVARAGTRDLGIRLALGADRMQLVSRTVFEASRTLVVGVVLGLGIAAFASRLLTDLLLYVEPRDQVTYGSVAVLMVVTGVIAAWIPASRTSKIDPVATLREE